MASPEDRIAILNALRPIFPQLNDGIIIESIETVRQTVGEVRELLIPACIDYLLAKNTENNQPNNGQNAAFPILIEDETAGIQRKPLVGSKRKRISDLEVSYIEEVDDSELMYVATSVQEGDKEIYMIDDSPPNNSSKDCLFVRNVNSTSKTQSTNAHTDQQLNITASNDPGFSNYANSSTSTTVNAATNVTNSTSSFTTSNEESSIPSLKFTEPVTYSFNEIKCLFPDVQEKFLREHIHQYGSAPADFIIANVCNVLLEKGYPKEEKKTEPVQTTTSSKIDYLKNYSSHPSGTYIGQCLTLLQNEFPKVSVLDIRSIAHKFNFHYAPTRKCLEEKLVEAFNLLKSSNSSATQTSTASNVSQRLGQPLRLLKGKRGSRKFVGLQTIDFELQKEIDFIRDYKLTEAQEKDRQMAFQLNNAQYEDAGQLIECGCCYVESTFEDMVQCLDGHLFCVSCLRSYAKEAVFGQGKAILSCMTSDCDSTFPMTQLQRSLESNILAKYEDRLAEESLNLAGMEDLVRCPHCDFAAIMPPDDKVFKCQNASCMKETCRYCKEEWKEHFGLKCSEIEKNDEKNMRISYEEKMTMAKIRKCHKCACEFTKSDGCNKMTCRCGTTMCYICRKPSISYNHFCQHPKDPGKKCSRCTSCSLWSDPSEDDDMAVKQIEREAKEAKEAKRQLSENTDDAHTTPSKKRKTSYDAANVSTHKVPVFPV